MIMLHGFGDGSNGWQVYENEFENWYPGSLDTYRFNYNNLLGVEKAADDIYDHLQTVLYYQDLNNILIAHST